MNPKKAREFIQPTAEKLGVDSNLVNDLASFFWSDVRKAVVDIKGHNIVIPGLGTMRIKPWKLNELIERYQSHVTRHKEKVESGEYISFSRFTIFKEVEAALQKALRIREQIELDMKRKQEIKQKRHGKGTEGSI